MATHNDMLVNIDKILDCVDEDGEIQEPEEKQDANLIQPHKSAAPTNSQIKSSLTQKEAILRTLKSKLRVEQDEEVGYYLMQVGHLISNTNADLCEKLNGQRKRDIFVEKEKNLRIITGLILKLFKIPNIIRLYGTEIQKIMELHGLIIDDDMLDTSKLDKLSAAFKMEFELQCGILIKVYINITTIYSSSHSVFDLHRTMI